MGHGYGGARLQVKKKGMRAEMVQNHCFDVFS